MISIYALQKLQLHDLTALLSWLQGLPIIQGKIDYERKRPPIQTSKLLPALTLLDYCGFVAENDEQFILTIAGRSFLRGSSSAKKSTIRIIFSKDDWIKRVLRLLRSSDTGRLPRKLVAESFNLYAEISANNDEFLGFIAWGESCELFGYDRATDEIFNLDQPPREKKNHWMASAS